MKRLHACQLSLSSWFFFNQENNSKIFLETLPLRVLFISHWEYWVSWPSLVERESGKARIFVCF